MTTGQTDIVVSSAERDTQTEQFFQRLKVTLERDPQNYLSAFVLFNNIKRNILKSYKEDEIERSFEEYFSEIFNMYGQNIGLDNFCTPDNIVDYVYSSFMQDESTQGKIKALLANEDGTIKSVFDKLKNTMTEKNKLSNTEFGDFVSLLNTQLELESLLSLFIKTYYKEIDELNGSMQQVSKKLQHSIQQNENLNTILSQYIDVKKTIADYNQLRCLTSNEVNTMALENELIYKHINSILSLTEIVPSHENDIHISSLIELKKFIDIARTQQVYSEKQIVLLLEIKLSQGINNDELVAFYKKRIELVTKLNELAVLLTTSEIKSFDLLIAYTEIIDYHLPNLLNNPDDKFTVFDNLCNQFDIGFSSAKLTDLIIKKLLEDKKLNDSFTILQSSIQKISHQPGSILFALNNFLLKLNEQYKKYKKNDNAIIDSNLKQSIFSLFSKKHQITLSKEECRQYASLINGTEKFALYCGRKKTESNTYEFYNKILNNRENLAYLQDDIHQQTVDEFFALPSSISMLSDFIEADSDDATKILGFTEHEFDNITPNYDAIENYLNINFCITIYQFEDTLIAWGTSVIDNICQYYIRYGHKEMLYHHQQDAAADLIRSVRKNLLNREMPVVERYANIIENLASIKPEQEYLHKITTNCLKDVKDFLPLVGNRQSASYQVMKTKQERSAKSDDDINIAINNTPVKVVEQARNQYMKKILQSKRVKNFQNTVEEKTGQDVPTATLISYALETESKIRRFLRWFSNTVTTSNQITKSLVQNGFRAVGHYCLPKNGLFKENTGKERVLLETHSSIHSKAVAPVA